MMRRMFTYLGCLIAAIILYSGTTCVAAPGADNVMQHGDAGDIAVATVNGSVVNMAQLMGRMLDLAEKRYGRREITNNLAVKIKNEALQELITEELAYQNAASLVHVSSADVKKAVEERIKALGGKTALAAYMKEKQIKNRAAFEEDTKKILTVQRYIQQKIVSQIKITEADAKLVYAKEKDKFFHHPENVQVTKISFFVDPKDTQARSVVRAVRQKIVNKLGNDATKLKADGTFVVQKAVHLNKVRDKKLYEAAKKLDKYGISEPIEMHGTLYLVQLTGYKPEDNKSFKDVHNYIQGELFKRRKQFLVNQWTATLRPAGTKIKIMDLMP